MGGADAGALGLLERPAPLSRIRSVASQIDRTGNAGSGTSNAGSSGSGVNLVGPGIHGC